MEIPIYAHLYLRGFVVTRVSICFSTASRLLSCSSLAFIQTPGGLISICVSILRKKKKSDIYSQIIMSLHITTLGHLSIAWIQLSCIQFSRDLHIQLPMLLIKGLYSYLLTVLYRTRRKKKTLAAVISPAWGFSFLILLSEITKPMLWISCLNLPLHIHDFYHQFWEIIIYYIALLLKCSVKLILKLNWSWIITHPWLIFFSYKFPLTMCLTTDTHFLVLSE